MAALLDIAPFIGAFVSLVIGVLGWARARDSDQVTSYRDLLEDYRTEVDRLRSEVSTLEDDLRKSQRDHSDEELDHDKTRSRLLAQLAERDRLLSDVQGELSYLRRVANREE